MNTAPNILFLLSDEHSFRFMGHIPEEEGGEPVETPSFDQLASQAAVMMDTYCQMPLCTPSRMCLFTGREVRWCGAWNNCAVLRPELPTIASTLGENGYATCLVGKYHLGGRNQFGGFQHRPYGDLTGNAGHQADPVVQLKREKEAASGIRHDRMRSRTTDIGISSIPESLLQENITATESVAWIREQVAAQPDQPYFLCASFSRPHFPLFAPARHIQYYRQRGITEPRVGPGGDAWLHPMSVGMREGFHVDAITHEEMMEARTAYFACVSFLDEIIGDMLSRLERDGLLDNTIIVYTSDHGEMAGEHGAWWKNGWYEGCTRVPLLISLPAHRSGNLMPSRVHTPVSLADLYPTLCGLTGTPVPGDLYGQDLSAAILGRADLDPERPVFCDNLIPRWGKGTEFRMIRRGNYKYIRFRNAPPLLFDLESDPGERHNLIGSADPAHAEAGRALEALAVETMDFDRAEQERTVRDVDLAKQYPLQLESAGRGAGGIHMGNLYILPDGRLVTAEDVLYRPHVVAENYRDVIG